MSGSFDTLHVRPYYRGSRTDTSGEVSYTVHETEAAIITASPSAHAHKV